MGEQRFSCTQCGKCCYGSLPLTVDEAFDFADRLPLALALTPVKPSEKSFRLACQLGAMLQLPNKQKVAVSIMPLAFIPPSLKCPLLVDDLRCSVHQTKPVRCRAMPFYAYKDEDQQATVLIPRKGWGCDTKPSAPVVYKDKKILTRQDFDAERSVLIQQADAWGVFLDKLIKQNPPIYSQLIGAAMKPVSARIIINFSTFVRYGQKGDIKDFAQKQQSVLQDWMKASSIDEGLVEFSNFYRDALVDLALFA